MRRPPSGAGSTTTVETFTQRMKQRYQTPNLVGTTASEFRARINDLVAVRDGKVEGFQDDTKQRDLSIRFHWGHHHDFGEFALTGRMGDRHLSIPARFVDDFEALPIDLSGKRVLDIGVWTGGTSLLLCALGAEVLAIEEVRKYAEATSYLKRAFGIRNLEVLNASLYDLNDAAFRDRFDYVLFSGVIYHVTDPIVALRIVFNSLKDGGTCLLESFAIPGEDSVLEYHGPSVVGDGSREDLNRSGWNWFVPSRSALRQMMTDVGFDAVTMGEVVDQRVLATGTRTAHTDMLRAGLSIRNIR